MNKRLDDLENALTPEWFDEWFAKNFREAAYSPRDLQRRLRLNRGGLYRALQTAELEGIRRGGRWIIPRPALRSWLVRGYSLNLE
jgi:hypothetical protein